MNHVLKTVSPGLIALHAWNRGGWWIALAHENALVPLSFSLANELTAHAGDQQCVAASFPTSAEELVSIVSDGKESKPDPLRLVVCPKDWALEDWARLDEARSRLEGRVAAILVLSLNSFGQLQSSAPHLASWLSSASVADFARDTISPQDRHSRLESLRAWAGKTDDEIRALALQQKLPGDPRYAEWLALLGEGELLVHQRS